eukprot:Rmarinus@m.23891
MDRTISGSRRVLRWRRHGWHAALQHRPGGCRGGGGPAGSIRSKPFGNQHDDESREPSPASPCWIRGREGFVSVRGGTNGCRCVIIALHLCVMLVCPCPTY